MAQLTFLGVPLHDGANQFGTIMGPDALRAAGLMATSGALGHQVEDLGDLEPPCAPPLAFPRNNAVRNLGTVAGWIEAIRARVEAMAPRDVPIFGGGDHALSAGSIAAMNRRAQSAGRPLFVLWLDAHPDFHTLETTTSGNLHGTARPWLT